MTDDQTEKDQRVSEVLRRAQELSNDLVAVVADLSALLAHQPTKGDRGDRQPG